eukprot:TRINITY_DN31415_c0_g2_i1.p1 TRINITY_DN31415_c0_g2~~TRINITY_DN31415_c0_g2_i1.p1  ORF type:complete len:101 (+),score=16.40 TRINITY_DN31415_c0_g2_i1:85-387(+)
MVCAKCEKKLAKLANPDVWREGGRNNTMNGKPGGRTINENMLLKHKQVNKSNPYGSKCKHCKCTLHQQGVYCSQCAYQNGFCAMCGKKIVDTSLHLMSTT